MYDFPHTRTALNALWSELRQAMGAHGIVDVPETLNFGGNLWDMWQSPDLLLGQTCGLPLRQGLHEYVSVLGAFDYGLPDTPAGQYHSVFVVRQDDPRHEVSDFDGARLAFNDEHSQSGWGAALAAGVRYGSALESGAHKLSVQAIAGGQADIAAIDAVSWRHLLIDEPAAKNLRVIGRSACLPGLAMITAQHHLVAPLRSCLSQALDALSPEMRGILGINGFVECSVDPYLALPDRPSFDAYVAENGGNTCAT